MNKTRYESTQEEVIYTVRFKMPKFYKIVSTCFLLFFSLEVLAGFILLFTEVEKGSAITIIVFSLIIIGIILLLFLPWKIGLQKSKCVITDRRLYGVKQFFLKHEYSYRLAEIEGVDKNTQIFSNNVIVKFNHGGTSACIEIKYLENVKEFYEVLSKQIGDIKNRLDLYTEIEDKKIDLEKEKVKALDKIASSTEKSNDSKSNYISEIKELKQLLDEGIITQEEFDAKKKELLKL